MILYLNIYYFLQDTVIAVQALYKASTYLTVTNEQNLTLTATHSNSNQITRSTINQQNFIVYNTDEVYDTSNIDCLQ